ncbi:expressed unknown protein [Seminavis robusta]|uniref:RING-type domain-containing protein n=1 Tax=Seminavis robusta TaxID=568900 RepID=A0A9N8ET98_9STRA|nr:expressed unknown protein [Seminavis robusta]|eukprot:Sro2055_g312800.1 n/a (186) ;mRNA; f:6528-7085
MPDGDSTMMDQWILHLFDAAFLLVCYGLYKTFQSMDAPYDRQKKDDDAAPPELIDDSVVSCASTLSCGVYQKKKQGKSKQQQQNSSDDNNSSGSCEQCPICLDDFQDGVCKVCCCKACRTGFHHHCMNRHLRAMANSSAACPCCRTILLHERNPHRRYSARDLGLPETITDFIECMAVHGCQVNA